MTESYQSLYGIRVNSVPNRNKYQESLWGKGLPARKADNFTAICELIGKEMLEPQRPTILWPAQGRLRVLISLIVSGNGDIRTAGCQAKV
jgi:hypothetical protein